MSGGFVARIKALFQAEVNGTIDGLEDPRATLDYSLARLEGNLQELNRSLVEVSAAHRRMAGQRERLAAQIEKHDEQAAAALQAGREDLARTVLERKGEAQSRLAEMESNVTSLERQIESLKENQLHLDRKIALFRAKKEELKSIYDSSRAQLRMREALSGISGDLADVGNTIQRVEERIQAMRARTDAINNLISEGLLVDVLEPEADDVDRQLAKMKRSQAVEEELARLKAQAVEE